MAEVRETMMGRMPRTPASSAYRRPPGGDGRMRWLRRRRPERPADPELASARKDTDARLRSARARRDREYRRLQEETRTLVQPMRQDRYANHFAELAELALRRHQED